MKVFTIFVFSAAIFACILADNDATDDVSAEKTDETEKKKKTQRSSLLDPPDPIDPTDFYEHLPAIYEKEHDQYQPPKHDIYPQPEPDYQPTDYGQTPDKYDYSKPEHYDYHKPDKYDNKPDKYEHPEDYETDDHKPDKYDHGKTGDYDYHKPDKYTTDHEYKPTGYGVYPIDPPGSLCKDDNICKRRGYKCCACADCNSDSFGCAETCACCPRKSVCCKAGLKNHFCCPHGSHCDSVHARCVIIKKVKPSKSDIFCGKCDYYEEKPEY